MTDEKSLITQEVLDEYGISSGKEQADFLQAYYYTVLLTNGKTVSEAAIEAGINRRNLYTPRWKDFINKASIIIRERTVQDVANIASYVHDQWPRIVKSVVEVANGPDMRLRTEAAKFLHEAYILPYEGQEKDDNQEVKYLKEKRDFNPARKILQDLIEDGGEVTLTVKQPPLTLTLPEQSSQDG